MRFQSGAILAFALSASFSLNALAAPYPFIVESRFVSSDYSFLDNSSGISSSGTVSWALLNGFSFDLLGKQAHATITSAYSGGTHNLLANSDSYAPSTNVEWHVNPGQFGITGVIDWNSVKTDFIVVWDEIQNGALTNYIATDVDGDGVKGFKLVNGPFSGYNFALNATLATPVPPAVWLFGSGLLALAGVGRRKTA